MAYTDQNIVIVPGIGSTTDVPKIIFTASNTTTTATITLRAYPTQGGQLSFEGSAGQLFAINNSLVGTIFSVNDISGIPSIAVQDTGLIQLAPYQGYVSIANTVTSTGTTTGALVVGGGVGIGGMLNIATATIQTGGLLNIKNGSNANLNNLALLSFEWNGAGNGYKHFITSQHNSGTGVYGNNISFWLNNSGTFNGSSSPTVGNLLTFQTDITRTSIYTTGGEHFRAAEGTGTVFYTTGTFVGPLVANSLTNSTSTNTGALQVRGGAGIQGNLAVGGQILALNGVTQITDAYEYASMAPGLVWRRYSHTQGANYPFSANDFTNIIKNTSTYVSQGITPNINAFTFNAENYLVEFSGYIFANSTGTYFFGVNSDDASDLFIDGNLAASWYGGHGATGVGTGGSTSSMFLSRGYHRLYTRFFEATGGDSHQIVYQSPTTATWTVIPSSELYHNGSDLIRSNSGTFYIATDTTVIGSLTVSGTLNASALVGSISTASNLAGGSAGAIPYQSSTGTTAFVTPASTSGYFLRSSTATVAPFWVSLGPVVLNDISSQFDGYKTVFNLVLDQTNINSIVDSKDLEVVVNGQRLAPYVDTYTWPWLTPYDSYRGYRVVSNTVTSQLIVYNAPYFGDAAVLTLRPLSTARQKKRYPFAATTVAFGD
jgi:hypothetical protein